MNIVKLDDVKHLYTNLAYQNGKPFLIPLNRVTENDIRDFLTETDQVFNEDMVKIITNHMHKPIAEVYLEGNIYTVGRLFSMLIDRKFDVFDLIGTGEAIDINDFDSENEPPTSLA